MTKSTVARDADLGRPSPAWMFVPMLAILMLVIVVGIVVVTSTWAPQTTY